jgi:hypothetical protein
MAVVEVVYDLVLLGRLLWGLDFVLDGVLFLFLPENCQSTPSHTDIRTMLGKEDCCEATEANPRIKRSSAVQRRS